MDARQNHNGSTIANHTPSRARDHAHGDASKGETDFCDTRAKQPRADTMSMIARHRRETKESQQLEPRTKIGKQKKQHKNTNHKNKNVQTDFGVLLVLRHERRERGRDRVAVPACVAEAAGQLRMEMQRPKKMTFHKKTEIKALPGYRLKHNKLVSANT